MNIVLLQTHLSLQDIEQLLHEFPHYLFLSFTEATYKNLSPENWSQVEILYGSRLTAEELAKAPQLHWIHSPDQDLNKLCMESIEKRENIILTAIREENLFQIGEFVRAGILAFSKNLFHFYDANKHPNLVWDSKWRDNMWTLLGKQMLIVGLNKASSEIGRIGHLLGMKVWGVDNKGTFEPHCNKTFSFTQLPELLPQADVVCLNLPKTRDYDGMIGKRELELMKDGSILVLLGNPKVLNEAAFIEIAGSGKFRGILIDAMYQTPIPASSPLWKLPNTLITPDIAPRPKTREGQSFALFKYNMRQYMHGNFKDMRNVINRRESLLV